MTLVQKIKAWIDDYINHLKAVLRTFSARSEEAAILEEYNDDLTKIQKIWDSALKNAIRTSNATGGVVNTDGGEQFSFKGENAADADKSALTKARELEKEGKSSEEIRQKTGWFKSYDGKWRFEIDDSKMTISFNGHNFRNPDLKKYYELEYKYLMGEASEKEITEFNTLSENLKGVNKNLTKLGDIISHPDLFKAYPQLADIEVKTIDDKFMPNSASAAISPTGDEIIVNRRTRMNKNELKKALIHEIQHGIQYIEGFAKGSSPDYWKSRVDSIGSELNWIREKTNEIENSILDKLDVLYNNGQLTDEEYESEFNSKLDKNKTYQDLKKYQKKLIDERNSLNGKTTNELYKNTAGEIEARDVSNRVDMTAEQRKNTRPDIDRTDVVFADDNGISLFAIKPDTDIENKNIANGNKVLGSMIEQAKTVENPETLIYKNAMYRSDIGQIDFVWGKPGNGARFKKGYGISHIIAKHGETTAKKAIEVIAKGTDYTKQGNNSTDETHYRIRLNYDGYTVVLSKDADSNHWLLTAWDNKEETAEYATGEVRDSTGATAATPTLNRRSGVNTTVSTDSIPNSDKNVKQFSLRDSDGNTLSKQQAEYFKESKIRDEDGNLLVVYHGIPNFGFTTFDINGID